ncbi:winged helix DNA-binding domain-containing protein [Streptomyces sp. NPDC090025]|uniref:winged helix DNA-binding domain-containing protein n=1 Tax=Streptomyces sp. NPDC090025 TaxID=3365922 RepID=UPI003838E87A
MPTAPLLTTRALNRATLDRQLLLRPAALTAEQAVHHLVGLQAQNTKPPYYALAARLDGFTPDDLSALMASRKVGRLASLRSTVHTHTAADAVSLRRLVQHGALDRELSMFRKGLTGVDLDQLTALTADLVAEAPQPPKALRERLLQTWPDADPLALTIAARCLLPMVQATPRGLWGRSGQVALTSAVRWFGYADDAPEAMAADLDATVLRYLAAFGPASVKDMQSWCGLTRLKAAFERLRPQLLVFRDEHDTELFDLPDAPRPAEDTPAPPRLLPEFDNLLLSHADRTRVVSAEHRARTWTVNQSHRVFLVDGFVAGLWWLDEAKDRTTVTLEPFGRLTRAQRTELTAEADRTLRLLGRPGLPYDIGFRATD